MSADEKLLLLLSYNFFHRPTVLRFWSSFCHRPIVVLLRWSLLDPVLQCSTNKQIECSYSYIDFGVLRKIQDKRSSHTDYLSLNPRIYLM